MDTGSSPGPPRRARRRLRKSCGGAPVGVSGRAQLSLPPTWALGPWANVPWPLGLWGSGALGPLRRALCNSALTSAPCPLRPGPWGPMKRAPSSDLGTLGLGALTSIPNARRLPNARFALRAQVRRSGPSMQDWMQI